MEKIEIMFILKSAETIKNAINKAKQIKPRVRMIQFGKCRVVNFVDWWMPLPASPESANKATPTPLSQ